MAIYVTGDLHSGFDIQKLYDWKIGPTLTRKDYLIVAGDFGYPWTFSDDEELELLWLEGGPYTVLFIDGNHERFDYLDERPYEEWHGGLVQRLRKNSPVRRLCRGQVYDIDNIRLFTMGGATSVDKQWRHQGEDWWPQELPDTENFDEACKNLDAVDWKVDYVVTHTCSNRMLPQALWPSPGWQNPSHDRLTDFLDELEDRLEFKHWYFGHMHKDRDCDEKHTLLYDNIVKMGSYID